MLQRRKGQILPHFPTFQDRNSRSRDNRSSSKAFAYDQNDIPILIEQGEILREMKGGNLGGVTTLGMIGRGGTKSNGAHVSRSPKYLF